MKIFFIIAVMMLEVASSKANAQVTRQDAVNHFNANVDVNIGDGKSFTVPISMIGTGVAETETGLIGYTRLWDGKGSKDTNLNINTVAPSANCATQEYYDDNPTYNCGR
ncbi:MAG TPA: hypothetical protein DIV86_00915 [Alphaproteobacteria bacterium]|nr:hypothetical protein [Alphaproteobacteria bacterium]